MKRATAAAVLMLGLVACGGTGSRAVSPSASVTLRADVQQIRAAAAAGDPTAATTKLAELRTRVATLRSQGQLTDPGVQRILAAANDVEQQLHLITTTTTSTTTSAPPDTTPDHGKGKGDGGGGD